MSIQVSLVSLALMANQAALVSPDLLVLRVQKDQEEIPASLDLLDSKDPQDLRDRLDLLDLKVRSVHQEQMD